MNGILGITLGSMLLPTVNAMTQRLTAFAGWISKAAEQHPALAKAAVIGAAALAALFVIFGVGAIVLAGIMGPIAIINAGLVAMGVAGGVASVGLLPIIGVVLAVVGAVALLYAAWSHWGEISAAWFAFWGGIRNGFIAAGNWLTTTGASLFATAGRMILQGLLHGIDPGVVLAKIKSIGLGAVRMFKSVLGIHSPSRVFAGLGDYMMQGLTNGIAGGEDGPVSRLHGLSRKMTGAIAVGAMATSVPASASAGSGGAPGGSRQAAARAAPIPPISIIINGAPGQDEQALAQLVAKKVSEALAGHGGSRGTYADQDEF